jgi:hypothetical protein
MITPAAVALPRRDPWLALATLLCVIGWGVLWWSLT